jgi:hypothetical protein
MTDDELQAMDAEIVEADQQAARAEQFLLLAQELVRVLDQPHPPNDPERREYMDTLLSEMRKLRA